MGTAHRIPHLRIFPFENRSGSISFRLSGTVRGIRVQRNFTSEGAAAAERSRLLSGFERDAPAAPIVTKLSAAAVRDAEAAILDLPAGATLRQAVAFFRAQWRPVEAVTLAKAAERWGTWLTHERKAKQETADYQAGVVRQFAQATECEFVAEVMSDGLRRWILDARLAVRSQRDRFDLLAYFFRWAVKHDLAATNPMLPLERPVLKNQAPPAVLTGEEIRTLLQCALTDAEGPAMLPYFAIASLSGVRPEEIPDLDAESVFLDEHKLIEVNRTKGGRRRRNAEICKPLARILGWCHERELAVNYFSRRKFRRIRDRAGLGKKWAKDILRHTYASHHYALHRDIGRLIKSMGNSEDVLFQHYVRPMPRADATRMLVKLGLDYAAPRARSAMGTGPKPRLFAAKPLSPPAATA